MAARTIVVLGGGTGGIIAARGIRRRVEAADRVVVVDRTPTFEFAPSFLWVMTGARRAAQVCVERARLRRRGIEILEADVVEIDAAHRRVKTHDGDLGFDRLLVALGAELAPHALAGFADAAHNIYTLDGATAAGKALAEIREGRVVVLVSRLPYKCPAAPYETAFLTEALLRQRGVRDHTAIDVYTPEPLPMPTAGPALGEALRAMLAERGIGFHPEHTVDRIDPDTHELVLRAVPRPAFCAPGPAGRALADRAICSGSRLQARCPRASG